MGHIDETQTPPDDMPNVPYTFRRENGVYYYKRRNPTALVEAGLAPTFRKHSLKTKDRREAQERAIREAAIHQAEMSRLLTQLERGETQQPAVEEDELTSLSALSKQEQRDLVLNWFVSMESKAGRARESLGKVEDQEDLDNARTDLSVYEGSPDYAPIDWEGDFSSYLRGAGFQPDEGQAGEEMLLLFKKAVIEVQWRTVESMEGKGFKEREPAFKGVHGFTEVTPPKAGKDIHTIQDICTRYPTRKRDGKLKGATTLSYVMPIRILEQFFGKGHPLDAITYEDGERLVRFLVTIPKSAANRHRGKTLGEAAAIEAGAADPQLLSPTRQKALLLAIKGILNYAVDIGWLDKNPLPNALLDLLPSVTRHEREQFTADDLTSIFNAPKYLKCRGAKDRDGRRAEGKFWLPLLGLFHGLRANEAASLLVEDVKEEDGIAYLEIRETDDAGEKRKNLKNAASERRVPLHREVIKIGFLDFVAAQREADAGGFLFPEMKPNKGTGNRAKVFSQWFGRLRSCALGGSVGFGKDFHSFRHAVTDCLRRAPDTSDEKRYALLGWTDDGSKKNAGWDYGSGYSVEYLKAFVDQIDYEGFDSSALYQ